MPTRMKRACVEHRLAPRPSVAVSLMAQTGQSEAIHSPDACARTVVRLTMPAAWLRAISSPLDSGA